MVFLFTSISLDRYEEIGVPIKATSFAFNDLETHSHMNLKRSSIIKRAEKENNEKPIFIVSNQKEIINQKQKGFDTQSQIYFHLVHNLSQRIFDSIIL